MPGRERWLGHVANRSAHVVVARHDGAPRPWLVCIHGLAMGTPKQDLRAFRARHLHVELGLNLAFYVLPVHGERAPGKRSGAEFLSWSPMNLVHAESQAIWDLRRLLGWIRALDAPRIGVFGLSLGGYTAALLAGLEAGLSLAILGIPPSDFVHTTERLSGSLGRIQARSLGLDWARDRRLTRVVSPLAFEPLVEPDGRFMFGGLGDRIVPVEQTRDLWIHWDRPPIVWSAGGHLSALGDKESRVMLDRALEMRLVDA